MAISKDHKKSLMNKISKIDAETEELKSKLEKKKELDKKIFFKLRAGDMTDEFEALCFYFSKSQQAMLETCVREYFKMALGKHSGLKKALEVTKERDEEDI